MVHIRNCTLVFSKGLIPLGLRPPPVDSGSAARAQARFARNVY
jgi:hypothetical protein